MFFSEFICLVIYYLYEGLRRHQVGEKQDQSSGKHKLLFAISGTFDLLNFFLNVYALTMVGVSIYQMMYGGTLLWTFLFSIFYLKKRYHRHHYLAVCTLLLGLIAVGAAGVIWTNVGEVSDL